MLYSCITMERFTLRSKCLICNSINLTELFEHDKETTISFSMYDNIYPDPVFLPYNVLRCSVCKTYQTKYLGNLSLIYRDNHVDSFGSVKKNMHVLFTNFILNTQDITGILEVGASTDALANELISSHLGRIPYSVVDPGFRGNRSNITVYDTFIEDIDMETVKGNTVVMSNLFEHLYHPMDVIDKIQRNPKNKYIFLNHPNFDHASTNDIHNFLNIEHIFYIDNDFVAKIFKNFGYRCVQQETYETHTIMFKFERAHEPLGLNIINTKTDEYLSGYFNRVVSKVNAVNHILNIPNTIVYMWPASAHTSILFTYGVDYKKMAGLLDNSPAKIGKFLYGYNLECFDFKHVLATCDENTVVVLGGSDCYLKELDIGHTRAKIVYLHDL